MTIVDAASEKAALRRQLVESFALFDPASVPEAANGMVERLLELPEVARSTRILTCLSFHKEIDTWRLVDRLLAAGREVYVPRADPRDRQLHVHRYPCDLQELSFGLRQPSRGTCELSAEAVNDTIDVALALGLAFDSRGYRLGYGTGYFDRFLAGRPFPAIGMCYHAQLIDRIPEESHDVPMAAIVTEAGVWRASQDSREPIKQLVSGNVLTRST
jgi:5-formyltetrahydrofolate cyclo-ligase